MASIYMEAHKVLILSHAIKPIICLSRLMQYITEYSLSHLALLVSLKLTMF